MSEPVTKQALDAATPTQWVLGRFVQAHFVEFVCMLPETQQKYEQLVRADERAVMAAAEAAKVAT